MNNSTTTSGISTSGLLGVLFIGLKLTGYIGWSWWWVLSPFWIPAVIGLSILMIPVLSIIIVWIVSEIVIILTANFRRRNKD